MKPIIPFILVFVAAAFFTVGRAAVPSGLGHSLLHYTDENGLPQNSVEQLAFDRTGFLWLAMPEGLLRFDGHTFTWRNRSIVVSHFASRNGRLYAVANTGSLYALENGKAFRVPYAEVPVAAPKPASPLLDFLPGKALPYAFDEKDYSYVISAGAGVRFLLLRDSLKKMERGETVSGVRLPSAYMEPWRFFTLGGNLYYLDERGTLLEPANRGRSVRPSGDLAKNSRYGRSGTEIRPLVNPVTGEVFVYLEDALYLLYATENGGIGSRQLMKGFDFSDHAISSVAYDPVHDRIFLGSYTDGLFVFSPRFFEALTYDEFVPSKMGNSYRAQVPYGKSSVLTSDGSILGLEEAKRYLEGFSDDADPNTMARDFRGNIWTKRMFELNRWDGRMQKMLGTWRLPHSISVLYADSDSSLWLGTAAPGSVYRLDLRAAEPEPEKLPVRMPDIRCIRRATADGVYLGTAMGLYLFDTRSGRVLPVPGLERMPIRSISVDTDDPQRVWVASKGRGLFLLRDGKAVPLPGDPENFVADARCLLPDSSGNFWISTGKGLLSVAKADLSAATEGKGAKPYYAYYGKSAGFNTNEFTGDCEPCGLILENGFFSFPSLNGLVWFRPGRVQAEYPSAPVYIDGIELDGKPWPVSDTLRLKRDFKRLTLDFAVPYFGHRNNLAWESRLDDQPWRPAPDGRVTFTSLSPGTHVFYIRKANGPGAGNVGYRKLTFEVAPAFWQTGWFILLCVLGGLGLTYAYIRLRVMYIRRKNRLLEEAISERTSELKQTIGALKISRDIIRRDAELQKRLTATIAHDVKTPLKYLLLTAGSLSKNPPEQLAQEHETVHTIYKSLYRIYHFTDNLLAYIRSRFVQAEAERIQTVPLRDLVQEKIDIFADFGRAQSTVLENDIPADLTWYGDPNLLSVVVHNVIDNAVKFTFNGKITCSATLHDGELEIKITDTGVGIHAEQMEHIQLFLESDDETWTPGYNKHSGMGLVIIKEIVRQQGGRILMDSEKGIGSTVWLYLPLRS